ncbi:MAG TPA: 3-phosphoshikimate 1-carboxyvinyltransferase [Elusimicrobiales bacterium]|nr:3-phosphoshikimate 1-carboxyvinyltransferase [Elusimicrobiales bacterium]
MKSYTPPPDKSITLRALLLGAIAAGRTVVSNPLSCADTAAAVRCLRALGVKLLVSKNKIIVEGRGHYGLLRPGGPLQAGEAGAVARLLAGILAGQSWPSKINGSGSLLRRPMARVAAPLALMSARVTTRAGKLPLEIRPAALKGIRYTLPVASAQVKSAILLAGLYASGETVIKEPVPSRDHTERLLGHFGARIARRGKTITLIPGPLKSARLAVPGDISAAAPFIAAALLSGRGLLIKDVGLNPSRLGFLRTLKKMGASFRITQGRAAPEPAGDILVYPGKLRGAAVGASGIPAMIDELPLLAVLAAAARGRTIIRGAGELRHKESDRIRSTLALLAALGADAKYRKGALEIQGTCLFRGGAFEPAGDHRLAMAAAAAGICAAAPLRIKGRGCVRKSYPAFFADFKKTFLC